jgi:hypothetical protein
MKKPEAIWVTVGLILSLPSSAQENLSSMAFAGMWSDPPPTIEGLFCFGGCTDEGLEILYDMLDDPANDELPFEELVGKAFAENLATALEPLLTDFSRKTFPLDQATLPSFLECEPWGFADEIFTPHQFEITVLDDRIELHYGEWDARRTVYMDGRNPPANEPDTPLGYSTGHMDGDTLIINTSHVQAGILWSSMNHSNQLRAEEHYTLSDDKQVLTMYVTMTDPIALSGPFTAKRFWKLAPDETIDPYVDCEIPTDFLEHQGELE